MKALRTAAIQLALLLASALGDVLLSACDQKDLVSDGEETGLRVEFDWTKAPEAEPEGMTILFFPADARSMSWRFDISGRDGGVIEMLSGVYDIIAFNNDLPGVDFNDTDSFEHLYASARVLSDSLTSPTGMLYSAAATRVAVFPSEGRGPTIRLTPDSISTVYSIRLDSVSGTQRIKTASANLRGPARSVCLCVQRNSEDGCCMSAPLRIAAGHTDRLEATAAGFGTPDIPDPRFLLDIIVTTSHGKYTKTFDVTDQVVNSKYPKSVDIYIKGLTIPEADSPTDPDGTQDVGISVGVDGWQLIEIVYS